MFSVKFAAQIVALAEFTDTAENSGNMFSSTNAVIPVDAIQMRRMYGGYNERRYLPKEKMIYSFDNTADDGYDGYDELLAWCTNLSSCNNDYDKNQFLTWEQIFNDQRLQSIKSRLPAKKFASLKTLKRDGVFPLKGKDKQYRLAAVSYDKQVKYASGGRRKQDEKEYAVWEKKKTRYGDNKVESSDNVIRLVFAPWVPNRVCNKGEGNFEKEIHQAIIVEFSRPAVVVLEKEIFDRIIDLSSKTTTLDSFYNCLDNVAATKHVAAVLRTVYGTRLSTRQARLSLPFQKTVSKGPGCHRLAFAPKEGNKAEQDEIFEGIYLDVFDVSSTSYQGLLDQVSVDTTPAKIKEAGKCKGGDDVTNEVQFIGPSSLNSDEGFGINQ